jgi:hypothetical protein
VTCDRYFQDAEKKKVKGVRIEAMDDGGRSRQLSCLKHSLQDHLAFLFGGHAVVAPLFQ